MKKIYSISYDFKHPDLDRYQDLFAKLQSFGNWWHFMLGTWLISTDMTAKQVFEELEPYIDKNVLLFITEVGPDMSGWLPQEAWQWIKQHRAEAEASAFSSTMSG